MDQSEGCENNNKKGNKKKGIGEPSQRIRKQNWTGEQTRLMLNLIREEQVSGRVASPGTFTMQFWNKLAIVLSSQSEPHRQGPECKIRWKTVKGEFSEYKQCVDKSGWGWCPDQRVPVGPPGAWEDLQKKNSKLYKCKSKPFEWFELMKEIVGTNVASGHCAAARKSGVPLEDLVSLTDSSDSNRDAEQELNEVDMNALQNQWGTEISMLGGDFDDDISMRPSPLARSGAASRTSSGKRTLEQSDGLECDEPANKKSSGNKNKGKEVNACLQDFLEESKKRSSIMEKKANKDKPVADKLIKVHKEGKVSPQEFVVLQRMLKDDELMKELFLSMDDDNLDWWIRENIDLYRQERGL